MSPVPIKGRGASSNPPNRFEEIRLERNEEWDPGEDTAPGTRFYRDSSQSVLTYNDSPDVGFEVSVNPYRGCEHGCIYCYARPFHEYLGFSAGLDFETRIMVKENAPELLRKELASPKWKPQTIAFSGVTDVYQPVERRLRVTRRCLEVMAEYRNPVGIVTKNHLVTRDIDLLQELARYSAAAVNVSVTSLNSDLARRLEPRTSAPQQRLDAIRALNKAGVPVGVLVAPVIPGLNDHEIPAILHAVGEAGARWAAHVVLRLPYAVSELFSNWLEQHEPGKRDKILNQVRSLRAGRLNDPRFGTRMSGEGPLADQISRLFAVAARKAGIPQERAQLSSASFRRVAGAQMELFGN